MPFRNSSLAGATPWLFSHGIELTFVPADAKEEPPNGDPYDDASYELGDLAKAIGLRGFYDFPHVDPGCVEWPTPVLNSWGEARQWWEGATALAEMIGFAPHNDNLESGMGHIHTQLTRAQMAVIQYDLTYRPYLCWIFASPNANSYCASKGDCQKDLWTRAYITWTNACDSWGRRRLTDTEFDKKEWHMWHHGARPDHEFGTLEWRMFDSAATWSEQEENLVFLIRYFAWCLRRNISPPAVSFSFGADAPKNQAFNYPTRNFLRLRNSKKACISEFFALLDALELPRDRYAWRIERNLIPAFEWGERK